TRHYHVRAGRINKSPGIALLRIEVVRWTRRVVIARIKQADDFDVEFVRRRGREVQLWRRLEDVWFDDQSIPPTEHPFRARHVGDFKWKRAAAIDIEIARRYGTGTASGTKDAAIPGKN